MKDVSFKVERGQIWYLPDSSDTSSVMSDRNNHLMAKSRPWLVISCDTNNKFAPIVNVIAVSRKNKDLPTHVKFFNLYGELNVVKCEHIMTKNISDFQDKGARYIGMLSNEKMIEVEVALMCQHQYSREALFCYMNKLGIDTTKKPEPVNKVNTEKKVVSRPVETKNKSQAFNPVIKDSDLSKLVISEDKNEDKDECKKAPVLGGKPLSKWSEEEKELFTKDCEVMGATELMDKYKFTKPQQVYDAKYRLKKFSAKK